MTRRTGTIAVLALVAVYAGVLVSGVRFGLPSRERLAAVHGEPAFSDTTIVRMNQAWATIAGSDSALRQVLNQDSLYAAPRVDRELETMRALRRMALYTTEPDEMHVPLALGRMKPRQLDFNPRFFQYGGMLFYGAALPIAAGGLMGFFPLKGGLDAVLRDPESMANLYTCGRLWIVFWTALMPWFAYRLARLFLPRGPSLAVAVLAAATPGFLAWGPVLKQVALTSSLGVLGVFASARAARSSRTWAWFLAGAALGLAGAAFVTHLILGSGLAAAWLLRAREGARPLFVRAVAAVMGAIVVFVVLNPYWILDWRSVTADAVAAMDWYKPHVTVETTMKVSGILPYAVGLLLAGFGPVAALAALLRGKDPARWVVAVASLALPLYYGWRMTGVPDLGPIWCRQFIVLGPLWAVLVADLVWPVAGRLGIAGVLVAGLVATIPADIAIVRNFRIDADTASTRYEAGRWIEDHIPEGSVIHVNQVVGPFSTPFFRLERYVVKTTGRAEDIGPGEWLVAAGTANLHGSEGLYSALRLIREFPSAAVPGAPTETFGFANGPVKVWRREG